MFHRRLALLGAVTVVACTALGAQLGRLTLVQGPALRAEAESRLTRERWIPTVRGRILDRQGRVLAADRAGYDVQIAYDTLTGAWATSEGRRLARRADVQAWRAATPEGRDALAQPYIEACAQRLEASRDELAELLGLSRADLDKRLGDVVTRVEGMKAAVADRARKRLEQQHLDRGLTLDEAARARIESIAGRPIAEERAGHTIAPGVSDTVGFELIRLSQARSPLPVAGRTGEEIATEAIPGLSVVNASERVYPLDEIEVEVDLATLPRPLAEDGAVRLTLAGVAAPLLGRVRQGVYETDVADRARALAADPMLARRARPDGGADRGSYQPGESVGHTGVERAYEHELRGLRGRQREQLQSGEVTTIPPERGRDVVLTIDTALQARVRAVMDPAVGLAQVHEWQHNTTLLPGTHLYGAAVVLDIASGEILAMVSTPTLPRDGDWAGYGLTTPEQVSFFTSLFAPEVNKCIAKPYPPGSIAKAAVLAGAVERGAYVLGERIESNGHLLPNNPEVYRSWIFKMYGVSHFDQLGRHPDAADALMVSDNIFFYTLGRRLGPERVADLYRDYGVGEAFDLGLGPEWPGRVGPLSGPGDGTDLGSSDAILMGIGQGPVTWTPLHAANAYATLARSGVVIEPRLVRDGSAPRVLRDLRIAPTTVDTVLHGLDLAVSDMTFGTGCSIDYGDGQAREPIFRVPGVRVWGKTGTAEAPAVTIDPDGEGPQGPVTMLSGDHSWFVVMVGEEGGPPRYVVSVVMDYAGSGGRVSGPICDQIIRALVAEGYLRPGGGA